MNLEVMFLSLEKKFEESLNLLSIDFRTSCLLTIDLVHIKNFYVRESKIC